MAEEEMIQKSIKYFIVVIFNLIILITLLALWTDPLELIINENICINEFLKIFSISLISLITLRVAVYFFRKMNILSTHKKIITSALITFLLSSFLYANYTNKIIKNLIQNRSLRMSILSKINANINEIDLNFASDHLTYEEYQEVAIMMWVPKIPKAAENISYQYYADLFLPDYSLSLTYDMPLHSKIEIINITEEQFTKTIDVEIIGDKKRVSHNEVRR